MERAFIKRLNKKHREKWNQNHTEILTNEDIEELKREMKKTITSSDEGLSPWKKAERIRQLQKELKATHRRTIIPYQPSSNEIIHTCHPSSIYLKYSFIVNLPDTNQSFYIPNVPNVPNVQFQFSIQPQPQSQKRTNASQNPKVYKSIKYSRISRNHFS